MSVGKRKSIPAKIIDERGTQDLFDLLLDKDARIKALLQEEKTDDLTRKLQGKKIQLEKELKKPDKQIDAYVEGMGKAEDGSTFMKKIEGILKWNDPPYSKSSLAESSSNIEEKI